MSLQFFSPLTLALGGLALAGGLFALARLRVRHKEHVVSTTLFWRQALEETHARELVQRFRHPWAYLLTLLIAGLMWFALAGPRFDASTAIERVVLVDASALDAARWKQLQPELERVLDSYDSGAVRVQFSGLAPAGLLAGYDEPRLARERLAAIPMPFAPRALEDDLLRLGRDRVDERELDVLVVAPTPVRGELLALLDENVRVRGFTTDAFVTADNRGITKLGIAEAVSGRFDRVDVLIEEIGPEGVEPIIALDGAALQIERIDRTTIDGHRQGILRDVPANGHTLRVTLPSGDGFPADDEAVLVLPRRTPVRVSVSVDDPNIALVLAHDPGVEVVEANAEVHIGSGGSLPSLELVGAGAEENAFQVLFSSGDDAERVLLETWASLGLAQVDGKGLAESLGEPIGFGARAGDQRSVRVRADLLSNDYDFTESQAFPLFVSGAVRWLAGVEPLVGEVRAGEALRVAGRRWATDGLPSLQTFGSTLTPPIAGRLTAGAEADGNELWASLLDAELSRGGRGDLGSLGEPVVLVKERGLLDLIGWLALLAFCALGLEWWLYQNGRMP